MKFEGDTIQPLKMELVLTKSGEILKGGENDISYVASQMIRSFAGVMK